MRAAIEPGFARQFAETKRKMSVHPGKEGTNMAEMATTRKATPKKAAPKAAAPKAAVPTAAAPNAAVPKAAVPTAAALKQNILVIDVGGTNLKLLDSNHTEPVKIPSGTTMTAERAVAEIRNATKDWGCTAVSMGYPGPVVNGKLLAEPHNLGPGWTDMNFEK